MYCFKASFQTGFSGKKKENIQGYSFSPFNSNNEPKSLATILTAIL